MGLLAPEMRQRAREAYAGALLKHSPTSKNLARQIIDGKFENWWITPAIDAIASVMRSMPDDGEDEGSERRAA